MPSTSPPRSPGSPRCSATGSPCATPGRSSPPARRFPMADEVKVTWPTPVFDDHGHELGPRDAVCILTHDPKFDVPAVHGALATRVGYIGVMGSRSTHERRTDRLVEAGVTTRTARSADVTDRTRHRRPHPRGDRRVDLCRDHRPPHRPQRPLAPRRRRRNSFLNVRPHARSPTTSPTRSRLPTDERNHRIRGSAHRCERTTPAMSEPTRYRDLAHRSAERAIRSRATTAWGRRSGRSWCDGR